MHRLVFLAPLLVAVLAGCADPADQAPAPDQALPVITDPRDLEASSQPGSHIHDYWGGRDRVTVLDAAGETWSTCSGGCEDGMAAAWRRPVEGIIVPQGTKWVNGTFRITPHPDSTFTSLELWVKTAMDDQTRRIGTIESGVPFSIESTQERNDPPHYVLSLWQFEVVAKSGGPDVTIRGDYTWAVEAVRGLPLVPYPPHPDRWNGATELDLLEDSGAAVLYYETDTTLACYASVDRCPGLHALPDGVVVPHDASRVEVRLSGMVVGLGLRFHGADSWSFTPVTARVDGTDLVFDIPLDGNGDSPYAAQSLWEFYVDLDMPTPAAAWTGSYTITATAYKE